MRTKILKSLKAAVLGTAITVMSVIPAYADTYYNDTFTDTNGNYYGNTIFDVDYASGMRQIYAWSGGLDDCQYRVKLVTAYSYGTEEEDTGFCDGHASISHSYEWADDYQSIHQVRSGIYIRDTKTYSGS